MDACSGPNLYLYIRNRPMSVPVKKRMDETKKNFWMGAGIGAVIIIIIDLLIPFLGPFIGGFTAGYIAKGDLLTDGKAGLLAGILAAIVVSVVVFAGIVSHPVAGYIPGLAPGFSCISSLPCIWLSLPSLAVQLPGLSGNKFSFPLLTKILTPLFDVWFVMVGDCLFLLIFPRFSGLYSHDIHGLTSSIHRGFFTFLPIVRKEQASPHPPPAACSPGDRR